MTSEIVAAAVGNVVYTFFEIYLGYRSGTLYREIVRVLITVIVDN